MAPHPGIRIHSISAEGGGGLIFAAGTMLIMLVAYPVLLPVVAASLAGGVALAAVLYRRHS